MKTAAVAALRRVAFLTSSFGEKWNPKAPRCPVWLKRVKRNPRPKSGDADGPLVYQIDSFLDGQELAAHLIDMKVANDGDMR